MRIGVIGTENSHADHIVHDLNVDHRHGPARVVGLSGSEPDRNARLSELGGIDLITETAAGLLGEVDAVVICDRHGDQHLPHALPFLEAGLPVFVDKPLACTVADARTIVEAAQANRALLMSCSALRYSPSAEALSEGLASIGDVRAVQMSGPADPASEYGGIFFYGIHGADTALRFAPGEIGEVITRHRDDLVQVHTSAGEVEVSLTYLRPDDAARTPFHLKIIGTAGVLNSEIVLGPHYVSNSLDTFFRMITNGRWPIAAEDLIRPITVLEQVRAATS